MYQNRANHGYASASAAYRHESGFTGTVDGTAATSRTVSSRLIPESVDEDAEETPPLSDPSQLGLRRSRFSLAPRLGYHHSYFGVELGAQFATGKLWDLVPSAQLWGGVPDLVFGWAGLFQGPIPYREIPLEVGLGHHGDRVRLQGGVQLFTPGVTGTVQFRAGSKSALWVGMRAAHAFDTDYPGTNAGLSLAYDWGRIGGN